MKTRVKSELSKSNEYHISRHRYHELKHFCMQYPEWKREIDAVGMYPQRNLIDGSIRHSIGSPVEAYIEKVERYRNYIGMLNRVADSTDPVLGKYILAGVTIGIPYDIVKMRFDIPICREKYYRLYRKFFWILDQERG